ncbi:MAG: sulfite exporter TauE/SafE family protein [Bdellovibrionales bacterium]|nr:sulfite exporter TauE/SafE family protein [Bdellovibrionales bacterium]
MELWLEFTLFLGAMMFSALGTIAGFGGGIFLIPLMVIGFSVPVEIAIGVTALSLFPSSLYSSVLNYRQKLIDLPLLVALEVPTIFGAYGGAHLTRWVPTRPLESAFACFLFFLAWKTLRPSDGSSPLLRWVTALNEQRPQVVKGSNPVSLWSAIFFGGFSGIIAGLFGIGGGILKTPIMIQVFKVPIRRATATALGMIVFTSLISGSTHYQLGHVSTSLLGPCAGGFFTGSIVGNFIGHRIHVDHLKRIIAASIGLAGVAVLIHAAFL